MKFIKERKNLLFNLVCIVALSLIVLTYINTIRIESKVNSLKEIDKITSSEDKKIFKNITEIYSSCKHEWIKLTEPTRKYDNYYITITCKKCGVVQVIDITNEALYINVE